MAKLQQYVQEPVNALTHLAGAVGSVVGLVFLIMFSRGDLPKMISLIVYGSSMIVLFTASALYHGATFVGQRGRMWLNRFDHMAIFLLIAGTYTAVVYNLYPFPLNWIVLLLIWPAAIVGCIFKLLSQRIHGFYNTVIYMVMAWGGVLSFWFAWDVLALVPWHGLLLLVLGGLIYSAGFVIYYSERPDPFPNVFGHHEIWHLFVLGGSLSHFLFILFYIARESVVVALGTG